MTSVQIWTDSRYPVSRKRMRLVVEKVIHDEQVTSPVTVSIAVVGDRKMRKLNLTYHETDATTDVLSFPYTDPLSQKDRGKFIVPPEEGIILGDIVISYPQAVKQAQEKNRLVDDELDFLVTHGMGHLFGHHHE